MQRYNTAMTEETAEPPLETASRRLTERAGFPLKLHWREAIEGFPHVVRCAVIGGGETPQTVPMTVIIKTPQRAERKARLLNVAASLDFLHRLPESDTLFWPRLVAVDIAQGFLVEEDFGSRTLRMALSDTLPGAAERARSAVEGWAVALGEVAARTRGWAAEFAAVRAPHAPREPHMNFDLANHLMEGRAVLTAAFAVLNIFPASNFDAEYGQVIADGSVGNSDSATLARKERRN